MEIEKSNIRKHEAECILGYIGRDSRRILDLGCNLGHFTHVIQERNPQARVCGADINRRAIGQAKKAYGDLDFYLADDDFFQDNRFDTLVMMHVLEHVRDIEELLSRCSRLLGKRGRLVVSVPQEWVRGSAAPGEFMLNLLRFKFKNPHLRRFNLGSLRAALEKAGFILGKHTYVNYFPPYRTASKKLFPFCLVIVAEKGQCPSR